MPGKTLKRTVWLLAMVALLAGVLVAGGCANKPTAEDIVVRIQEVMGSTNDAYAVVEVTADVQSESLQIVAKVWGKQPNKARVELMEANREELAGAMAVTDGQTASAGFRTVLAGAIVVTDGQTVWFYSPAENQVVVADVSDMPADAQVIIQSMEGLIQRVLDACDVELLGEEEVAGTETYKLRLTPKEGEEQSLPVTGTATLWVDKEQWIVLKAHFIAPNLGEGTVQVRSFELNPGLDDEIFTFEVPEGAQVINLEDERAQHMTLDEAVAQASFDLLTPDYVPDGAVLVDVFKARDAFVLLYDLDGINFTVAQSLEPLPLGLPGAEEAATVRGIQATLITDEVLGASVLAWQENGINFAIAGRIGGDEAIKIAESLK